MVKYKFISVVLNILPNLIRAVSVVVVYKFVSVNFGAEGLITFALGATIASLSNSLSLGCTHNYIVSTIRRDGRISVGNKHAIFFLVLVGCVICIVFSFLLYLNSPELYGYYGVSGVVVVAMVSYFGFSLNSAMSSVLIGRLNNNQYVRYSSLSSTLFLILFFLLSQYDYGLIIYFGLLGYPLLAGLVSFLFLARSGYLTNVSLTGVGFKKNLRAVFVSSLPVYISAISLPVFSNGIITSSELVGENFSAGIISCLRFTDMIGVFTGAIISAWVFPRICTWNKSAKHKTLLNNSFLAVFVFSAVSYCFVVMQWDYMVSVFFIKTEKLPLDVIAFFCIGEVARISLPVLGYALMDAKMIFLYFIVELFSKLLIGLLAEQIVLFGGYRALSLIYAAVMLTVVSFLVYVINKKNI